jgi:hypothetical protein
MAAGGGKSIQVLSYAGACMARGEAGILRLPFAPRNPSVVATPSQVVLTGPIVRCARQ